MISRFSPNSDMEANICKGLRSHSAQGLSNTVSSPAMKIPLPPRLWITDIEDESSDDENGSLKDDGSVIERPRVRSRFRHHKQRSTSIPIGIFWDIENCQVPRGCSAIDVVAAIRAKFLVGRREADFVVVCDVRKEQAYRLQELNDAQVSLIHVCGTQKNAADEKLRQCMRRFGELHSAPAALLLISGDINFAADLSDFRHRKNMEVILVHKQNTSSALIACASQHYGYHVLTAALPRNPKNLSVPLEEEPPAQCEMEVCGLPAELPAERVSRRLRRLADNCGGRVLRVAHGTALLRFPTPDHASRALKRMDGEDVFGRKISTRYARSSGQPTYSSDEGYSTGTALPTQTRSQGAAEWALALQALPRPEAVPPAPPKPRKITGTHGSVNLDRSGCSSSNSGENLSQSRALSPWNCSTFSEQSEGEEPAPADLTVTNLPPYEPAALQEMLTQLFSQYVPVVGVSVWAGGEGPVGSVLVRSEWDARVAIARVHKRRLEHAWCGRRLELAIGRAPPAPPAPVLRARLRAILREQRSHALPLLRLRDAYASRHAAPLTANDITKVKDTVIIHEGLGRMVQLIDTSPPGADEAEEAPWKCREHAAPGCSAEDGSRTLQPVYMEVDALARAVHALLDTHARALPLLSFVECYSASFPPLVVDARRGVPLELLLRHVPGVEVRDSPCRHLELTQSDTSTSSSERERERGRTAPALEPMLALFERELVDLLRTAPRCTIPFSKLIPAFHHHFGRQCRVADYGFTKLPDLLAALGNTIVVLGSGSTRVITLSAAAQTRRWTSDLVKLLKAQPGRALALVDIPSLYHSTFGKVFSPADYGLCTLHELMARVPSHAVRVEGGEASLPRRAPTPEECARTSQFAAQTVELLYYTANLRVEFSRFVPAYHAHFGRQLRVNHYGCAKLAELLELVPAVVVRPAPADRLVCLAPAAAGPALAQRLRAMGPTPLDTFAAVYAAHYGAPPSPDMLDKQTIEELIYACGGCIENGTVMPPGSSARWASALLCACAALCADRSVARGSTVEYFAQAYRQLTGHEPSLPLLMAAGVVRAEEARVCLTAGWRCAWRVAQALSALGAARAADLYAEYCRRYPAHDDFDGVEGLSEVVRQHGGVFALGADGAWRVAGGRVPRCPPPRPSEDYSLHDTPPGQKGSRVFESPRCAALWSSPPASALPAPTALLPHEKRRTRLAAQFAAP